jgi:hypothetical protein
MIDYNVLKVIRGLNKDQLIDSIIGSVNPKQQECKDWLIDESSKYIEVMQDPKICVAAGWYGLLASKLRDFTENEILSFDIDPMCKTIGKKLYKNDYGIKFDTKDIKEFYPNEYDILVCTSCEHITDDDLNNFLSRGKKSSLIILQSNNYFDLEEHINCKNNIGEFEWSVNIEPLYRGELDMGKYTRYMLIGLANK